MTEFKINAQSHIIDDVIEHLHNGMIGMGIARKFNYERKGDTIYFTLKEREKIDLADIFWFGYLTKD